MAHFTRSTFGFLQDLSENNDREWFNENKDRYLAAVQEPALDFITSFSGPLGKISPHFVADARAVGGSMFRIHRDTRFSKDKTPYKENTGVQFRHEAAKDAHAPGYYLHIQPGECFIGVGLWRPETSVAYQIRNHITEHPDAWKKATRRKPFTDVFEMAGESLVRPPKGFPDDHPLIDDLKRKDFIASRRLTQKEVTASDFLETFTGHCRAATPFMRFLCQAVGVPF